MSVQNARRAEMGARGAAPGEGGGAPGGVNPLGRRASTPASAASSTAPDDEDGEGARRRRKPSPAAAAASADDMTALDSRGWTRRGAPGRSAEAECERARNVH